MVNNSVQSGGGGREGWGVEREEASPEGTGLAGGPACLNRGRQPRSARSQLHTVSPVPPAMAKSNLHLTPLGKIYMAAVPSCLASAGV